MVNAEYAQVIKMLGNGRLEATCFDGEKRLCHIRGKMRKKVGLFANLFLDKAEAHVFLFSRYIGLDQPRRHNTALFKRISGRQGRCNPKVYYGRS